MSPDTERSSEALPSLAGAAWLGAGPVRTVLDALAAAGHEGRIVGGAVRNALMGLPAADVDIATPAVPEAVLAAAARAGLQAVPTGIEHGTVTIIAAHHPVEVTTLRRDVTTDGRRATVAFTDDWAEDAARRDFTMNALYCDAQGRLCDPVGGYGDILARRVRFIGDPDRRIAEDYLRILRFFRFHASYASGAPDADGLAACVRGREGLIRLSAERIRAELVRLLVAPGAVEALEAMSAAGLLSRVLGKAPRPGLLARLREAEAVLGEPPEAMLRLSALAVAVEEDAPSLALRLRLSRAEQQALIPFDGRLLGRLLPLDRRRARQAIYRLGEKGARRQATALLACDRHAIEEARQLVAMSATWPRPKLPVAGAEVAALGIAPGPRTGRILARLEAWWIEQDFPDAEAVQAELEVIVQATE